MNKVLFAVSLLVVAPMVKAEQSRVDQQDTMAQAVSDNVAQTVSAPATEVTPATVVAPVSSATEVIPATVVAPVSKNIFVRGYEKTVNGCVYLKDGLVYVYDATTGKFESFTPQFILSARDSVRSLIANYPLLAVALTAFVTVKAVDYLSDESMFEDEF